MTALLAALSAVLLVMAAWRDVAVRTIPNRLVLALFVVEVSGRFALGFVALLGSLAVALMLFLLLVLLHGRGLLGGGDVKLATAFAAGLTPIDTYYFTVVVALVGGVLGLAYLLIPRFIVTPSFAPSKGSLLARIRVVETNRIRRRHSLPYGVAIALGGILVLLRAQIQ
jgi:prepilin peptidase CpaA